MATQLQIIEHKLNALRSIDVSSLDLEDRIDYHQAMREVLSTRLSYLLKCFNYRTALVVDAQIKEEDKALKRCYELLSPTQAKKLNVEKQPENRFRQLGEDSKELKLSIEDVKRNFRTILFGVPYDVTYDGKSFTFIFKLPNLNIEPELLRFEEFAKTNNFKLVDAKTGNKRKKDSTDSVRLELF